MSRTPHLQCSVHWTVVVHAIPLAGPTSARFRAPFERLTRREKRKGGERPRAKLLREIGAEHPPAHGRRLATPRVHSHRVAEHSDRAASRSRRSLVHSSLHLIHSSAFGGGRDAVGGLLTGYLLHFA